MNDDLLVQVGRIMGLTAVLLASVGLALIGLWAHRMLRVPQSKAVTPAELDQIEGYAAIRQELVAIRTEMAGLSRVVSGLVTHVDGQHEVVMQAIGRSHDTCKLRRQA